jgi:CRP/FNR family cyclic AMP-dependent transcriptional regulator
VTTVTASEFSGRFPAVAAGLDEAQVGRLFALFERNEIGADEYVIAEGTRSDALYLVWDGELEAVTDTPGGDRQVGLVGPGELLGDISLLDPGPATASVLAPQGCVVLRLERSAFDELRASDPAVASALLHLLLQSLAGRVRTATEQYEFLVNQRPASPVRLADDLVDVHRRLYAGTADAGGAAADA